MKSVYVLLLIMALSPQQMYGATYITISGDASGNSFRGNEFFAITPAAGTTLTTASISVALIQSLGSDFYSQAISGNGRQIYGIYRSSMESTDQYGNQRQTVTWENQRVELGIDQSYSANTNLKIGYQTFSPSDPYPVSGTFPAGIQTYLAASTAAQSGNIDIRSRAQSIVSGSTRQSEAVVKLAKWIVDNITYNENAPANDAVNVLLNRSGTCPGFTNLMIAFLRSCGIPARSCAGVVAKGVQYFPNASISFEASGFHATYEVYYASMRNYTGWEMGDAQNSVHFLTNHSLIYARGMDASKDNNRLVNFTYSIPSSGQLPTTKMETNVTLSNLWNNTAQYSIEGAGNILLGVKPALSGVEDYITITSGPKQFTHPAVAGTYQSTFRDNLPVSHATSWDWELSFYHSTGRYVARSVTGLSGYDQSSWAFSGFSLPSTYLWSRDQNNLVAGKVTVHTKDSDGADHSDYWNVTYAAPLSPAAPLLSFPGNNAVDVAQSFTFQWQASSTATSYQLQVSQSPSFLSPIVDAGSLTATSYNVANLVSGTTYFWRVSAKGDWGESPWSAISSFTVVSPPPAAPVLSYPVDLATGIPQSLTFLWATSPTATSYQIQVSRNPDFLSLDVDARSIAGTSFSIANLMGGALYYWRVCAQGSGGTGPWSMGSSYSTIVPQDITFQNQTITVPLGNLTAHNSMTVANDHFLSGGGISLRAGNTVSVNDGVTIENGSAVNFVVDPVYK